MTTATAPAMRTSRQYADDLIAAEPYRDRLDNIFETAQQAFFEARDLVAAVPAGWTTTGGADATYVLRMIGDDCADIAANCDTARDAAHDGDLVRVSGMFESAAFTLGSIRRLLAMLADAAR